MLVLSLELATGLFYLSSFIIRYCSIVIRVSSENWLHFVMKQVLRRHQAVSVSLLAEKQCLKSYDHFPAFLLDFT